MTGDSEFCEVFLDGVVGARRRPARPGERGLAGRHRGAARRARVERRPGWSSLERRLDHLRSLVGDDPRPAGRRCCGSTCGARRCARCCCGAAAAGPAAASSAKLLRTELEFDIEVLLSTLRGPEALLAGPATDRFLYAPGMRIAGGTSEIQRNIIAERVLGLPREPSTSR